MNIIELSNSSRMAVIDLESKLLQEGIIEINNEFTAESVSVWRNSLLYLMHKFTPEDTKEHPIQLHINSPGGDIYSMLGLYDVIQLMKTKGYIIETINVGMAASAACFILMSGTPGYRKSLSHCRAMLHTASSTSIGKVADMVADVNELQTIQEVLNKLISEHANPQIIVDCKFVDLWMDVEEALTYKIIDIIV